MALRLQDPLVGQVVDGRYAVLSRIAAGGMATVYLATDARLGRQVALKVMHPHLAGDEVFVQRFAREARAAAGLSHPGVVGVYDQGAEGATVYLAMEHVPGRTLRDVLTERGALTPGEALAVVAAVLDALASAHRADLVHRDVKPENILVGLDGRLRVADFGLARAASASTTAASGLMGTVAYLAPELVTHGRADARADVYAAGVVLFELLTGTLPFTGDVPAQVAFAHVAGDVPPPSSRQPHLPRELDDLVGWATARDPDRRPADAGELLAAVRHVREVLPAAVLAREPDPAPTVSVGQPTAVDRREHVLALPIDEVLSAQAQRTSVQHPSAHRVPPQHVPVQRTSVRAAPDPEAPAERRPRRRWRLAALVALALAVLAAAVLGWSVLAGPLQTVPVPNVVTATAAEAGTTLERRELTPTVQERYDDQAAAGVVVEQDPPPGEEVRTGTDVVLTVSLGPELFAVPGVTGRPREEAAAALEGARMAVGEVTEEFSEEVPAGAVVSQGTAADEQVRAGTPVDLVVSRGREPVEIPDVRNRSQEDAEQAVTDADLVVGVVTRQESESVPEGSVIRSEPESGEVPPGTKVTLVVSDGPPLVVVPDVFGRNVDEATRTLQDAGFAVQVEAVFGGVLGTVRSQSVAAGQEAEKGTTIVLSVV